MKNLILIALLLAAITLIMGCNLFNSKEEALAFSPYEEESFSRPKGLEAFVAEALDTDPFCTSPPTLEEVEKGKLEYSDKFYSLKQAYKLGIPIVNADFSKNSKVYVRDYSRYKPCASSDGTSTLNYGQVIRSVIEIEDYDANTGISLASIAANGTLSNKKQSFYIYKDGISNPKIDKIISEVSGKVFNVENYTLYQQVMTKMIDILAEKETKWSVNKIGVVKKLDDDQFLSEAPIVAFTLSKIEKGKNCSDIKSSFGSNKNAIEMVERTFGALDINCSEQVISDEAKMKAKKLLQGIKVK